MNRRFRMSVRISVFLAALLVALGAAFSAPASADEIYLLCGAGLRGPVDKLTSAFTKETGIDVKTEYGGAGKLLARLEATGEGDVYIPGSHFYVDKLKAEGSVESARPVVLHTPVVAVWRETDKTIEAFADLAEAGVRVGLGDPKAMALGRTAEQILRSSGMAGTILPNVVVRAATVKQLALYVKRGDVDAAIIGRADAVQFRDAVRMIDIDPEWYTPEIISVAVLKTSRNPEAARTFTDFMSSPAAVRVFEKHGFLPLKP